jgi:hypothetical protein
MQFRLPALLVAVGVVAASSGCSDGLGIKPQFPNFEVQDTVYALTGTSPLLASGILLRDANPKKVDGSFNFDIAFDLDADNNVHVYTQRYIGTQLITGHAVGLLTTSQPFDAINRAPTGGFKYDSTLVLPLHQTLLVDVVDPTCSVLSILGPNIKSKLVVDSVNTQNRQIFVHVLVDPNCGFTSLVQGTPKD